MIHKVPEYSKLEYILDKNKKIVRAIDATYEDYNNFVTNPDSALVARTVTTNYTIETVFEGRLSGNVGWNGIGFVTRVSINTIFVDSNSNDSYSVGSMKVYPTFEDAKKGHYRIVKEYTAGFGNIVTDDSVIVEEKDEVLMNFEDTINF